MDKIVVFDIYFSDLNPEAQQRLLDMLEIKDPSEMNWDMDILPIAMYTTILEEEDVKPCVPRKRGKTK